MIKRIPQPIKDKILLHNPDLSDYEKKLLQDYGAVRIESLESILENTSNLTAGEKMIIRKHVFTKGTRAQPETKEKTPEQQARDQAILDRLKANLVEDSEPEK